MLRGEALAWYTTLPPNTVDCFSIVETLFGRQYASSRASELTHIALINAEQEKEETLKAFMKRYNETTHQVRDFNHTFIINDLLSVLRAGPFAYSLCARASKSMDEL